MPLHVHQSSTCDVCQEEYYNFSALLDGEVVPRTPHGIGCGHVFCIQCLKACRPSQCPLCRVPYDATRIKKLHVDKHTADGYDSFAKEEIRQVRSTVRGFEEGLSDQVINELLVEASTWLNGGAGYGSSSTGIRSEAVKTIYDALFRYKTIVRQTSSFEDERRELHRQINILKGEVLTAEVVERSLIEEQTKMKAEVIRLLSNDNTTLNILCSLTTDCALWINTSTINTMKLGSLGKKIGN
ncbi:hypothetical protein BXZ70DRAFT_724506 [Cristinia sonorae]|uniref:RING-type domain-containing protein n=1 Tax=Cristinia sonorae TaxID=1940300 RepID=A0A8K0XS31_9AGAR|nr:hypothetical protein BXZ70DRAFT_724506 [Cristinia sonorae]